jgi:hypothetical protein
MKLALVLAVVLTGCSQQTLDAPTDLPPADVGEFTPVDGGDIAEEGQAGRDFRRMDVDQLSASIERVTGHAWTRDDGGEEIDRFQELAPTLGAPDYIEVVSDTLSPSLLFQKFLDDAALAVCPRLVQDDWARADGTRWLIRYVDPTDTSDSPDMQRTLQDALLRFHGTAVADDSQQLAEWAFLMRSLTEVASEPQTGWESLCVALITHPDFYLY